MQPISARQIVFEFFLMKIHTEVCVQWDLLRKSKISGQCLHTLPRYGNKKKIRFSATLFYNQLLLLIKFYLVKAYCRMGKLRTVGIFEISQLVRKL